jgi:microsomal dipeptidase-like Zn-dependent dipeptidase
VVAAAFLASSSLGCAGRGQGHAPGGDAGVATDKADVALVAPAPDAARASLQTSLQTWRFGPARRDDCTAAGLRQISAPLRNVPAGVDALFACAQTARNVMGLDFAAPSRCVDQGGVRGQWDVPDASCAATAPAMPVRGGDGGLRSSAPLEGYADLHLHQMGHLGFAGSVVWGGAFGAPAEVLGPIPAAMKRGHDLSEALVDGDVLDVLGGVVGVPSHGEQGYPGFADWPSRALATHQQAYEDWLFRAYQGGLRLMVMLAVNSEDMFGRGENDLGPLGLVTIQGTRAPGRSSNDMEALEWQVREAFRMQASIDARQGGPGRGWYRIVRDPEEASAAIARGQLAVVLGTELQHLLNCDVDRPACNEQVVDEGLDRLEAMGVSYVFPVHHKLNQFSGAAQFNPLTSGATFDCFETSEPCAAAGLTPLGRHLVEELMARGMMIDTEHMSWKAFDDTLAIAEARGYPLMAGHIGLFDLRADEKQTEHLRRTDQIRRLLAGGGMLGLIEGVSVDEYARGAGPVPLPMSCGGGDRWANGYLYLRDLAAGGLVGPAGRITVGSDWNGFAAWPAPRLGCQPRQARDGTPIPRPAPVSYPLPLPPSLVPAAVGPSASLPAPGRWDYDSEGLMHVGLTPEFFEDLRLMGLTLGDLEPIYRSARGVVELWRTARARLGPGDRHHLRWAPARSFDLLPVGRDQSRDVEVAPGVLLCRTRREHALGLERDGVCVTLEAQAPVPGPADEVLATYHAGRCLDVEGRSVRDGARVQQVTCNGGNNQRWQLRAAGGGALELVASHSGKCLEVEGGAGGAGAAVVQRACSGAPHQRWQAERSGNTFALRAAHSQLCLEVKDQSRADGAAVVQADCSGAAHQLWVIESLRGSDFERLYQADLGQIAWRVDSDGVHTLPVSAGDDRAICRVGAALGVVIGTECVGRAANGDAVRAGKFERLLQTP